MTNSFYTEEGLFQLGLHAIGKNVKISRKCSIYGAANVSIGDNVRIDDFCIISGKVSIGCYSHIAAYTCLFGGESGIKLHDFVGLSTRCAVYAVTDDYSGLALSNPSIPNKYRKVTDKPVELKKHVLVGTGSTILPGVILEEGVAVGCMSLVKKSLEAWGLYMGIPCHRIRERSKDLLEFESLLVADQNR